MYAARLPAQLRLAGPLPHVSAGWVLPRLAGRQATRAASRPPPRTPRTPLDPPPDADAEPKNAKRNLAMTLAYDGCHFIGSQINPDPAIPTVDAALVAALQRCGYADPRNCEPREIGERLSWSRASRTDRGVHALGNVIGMRVRVDPALIGPNRHAPAVAEALNAALPPHLRVLSVIRTTRSFSAHKAGLSRVYHYFLPPHMLLPPGTPRDAPLPPLEELSSRLSSVLSNYLGTNLFHNFTLPSIRSELVFPKHAGLSEEEAAGVGVGGAEALAGGGEGEAALAGSEKKETKRYHPLWEAMGMLPSGQLLTPSSGSPPPDASPTSRRWLADNPFTRLYTLVTSGKADPEAFTGSSSPVSSPSSASSTPSPWVRQYGSPEGWRFGSPCSRTIYACHVTPMVVVQGQGGAAQLVPARGWVAAAGGGRIASTDPLLAPYRSIAYHRAGRGGNSKGGAAQKAAPSPLPSPAPAPSSTPLLRITLHGSSFMLHQIRFMVGAAIAVVRGQLDPQYLRAALRLPLVPALPLAPAGGLVQAEVHMNPSSGVAWSHRPGVPDDAVPDLDETGRDRTWVEVPGSGQGKGSASGPWLPTKLFPNDEALLLSRHMTSRLAFFNAALLPRLLQFAYGQQASTPTADAEVADGAPISPVTETADAWLADLDTRLPPPPVAAAVVDLYRSRWAPDAAERDALRSAREARTQDSGLDRIDALLADAGLPPFAPRGLDGSRVYPPPSSPYASPATVLPPWLLSAVDEHVLPPGLARDISLATGVLRPEEVADVMRGLSARIVRGAWPAATGCAAQHVGWMTKTGQDAVKALPQGVTWVDAFGDGFGSGSHEAVTTTAASSTDTAGGSAEGPPYAYIGACVLAREGRALRLRFPDAPVASRQQHPPRAKQRVAAVGAAAEVSLTGMSSRHVPSPLD